MSLNIPDDAKELENKSLTDLARELPSTANPFLEESWMGAQAIANARRIFDFYNQLRILELECIPITAEEKLELWASFWGITRDAATQATGVVVATGTPGSLIPQSTELQSSNGNSYTTANDVTITAQVVNVTSLTSVGTTATFVLASDTPLYTGQSLTFAGADQTEYNITAEITATGTNSGTYTIASAATTPATGTITASFTSAALSVKSVGFGQNQNQLANARLTFTTPIAGVDSAAFVDFSAIGGGTDIQSLDSLRTEFLDRVQNPVALFNASAIRAQARTVPGVTDVFIFEVTPAEGQVTIYPIRGNDDNPIPDVSEITPIKSAILEIKPAHTSDDDVIVLIATAVNAQFTFSAITPNDQDTRDRVTANLNALFRDEAAVSVALTEEQYNAAIVNAGVTSFTLSSPVGDIGGAAGEYPIFTGADFP